jgi:hypothetical protein
MDVAWIILAPAGAVPDYCHCTRPLRKMVS